MSNLFLVLLAVLVVLAAVWAIVLSFARDAPPATDLKQLKGLFAARRHSSSQFNGGLLVHTMTIEDAERLLSPQDFVLDGNDIAICDCSYPDKNQSGSCSAWTYVRSDLMPTIFNTPLKINSSTTASTWQDAAKTYSTPVIGLIVDPVLIWPLITNMGVVDSSTDERNCGQYYWDDSKSVQVTCTAADRGVGQDGIVTFHGPLGPSELCPKDCDEHDARCKLQNAGGTITVSKLGASDLGNWGCEDCSGPFPAGGVSGNMAGCSQSSLPFICRLDDGASPEDNIVDPHAWAPSGKRAGYAHAHIGRNGERMQNLFETPTGLADNWRVGGTQCKFARDDWEAWVEAIKLYYRTVWKFYDPSTKELRAELEATYGRNYLMSCPRYNFSFFENEVNLYFNRKSDITKYQELARHQSEILRNAVVGFFYVGKTCKEQLAVLEASVCSYDGKTYAGAGDRCEAWFCGKDGTQACRETWEADEGKYLQRAKELSIEMAKKFNAAYRSSSSKRPAGVFKYVGSNSSFLDMTFLQQLVANEEIALDSIFQQG